MYTKNSLIFTQFNFSSIDFRCFTPRTDKYRIEFVVTATYYITEHCSGASAVTTTADPQTTTEYLLTSRTRTSEEPLYDRLQ